MDADEAERPVACFRRGQDPEVADRLGRRGDPVQHPCERVVGGEQPVLPVVEEEIAVAAVADVPEALVVGDAGEEEVGAADDGRVVRVGAAAEGHEGRDVPVAVPDEEADEGRRVERAEQGAEGRGRADGVEEAAAGGGGADEGRKGGEADEDLEEEVVADGEYGGGSGWRGFRRRRRQLGGYDSSQIRFTAYSR